MGGMEGDGISPLGLYTKSYLFLFVGSCGNNYFALCIRSRKSVSNVARMGREILVKSLKFKVQR